MSMDIHYGLQAMFGKPIVQLSEVSESFFGMKYATAKAKVSNHEFPIPAFRLHEESEANKGTKVPLLIRVNDLADYVVRKHEEERARMESIYGKFHRH
ncbi:pyocin activator PrtN family protein [Vibrio sp. HI00D65]|uniref:pyocin activator PrtN family protein n=1 Tax=Vibrio sp. HI00D65 TaxID=1822216 RepID=UPI0009EF616C|nr:pyocin activator PrtN family protein [Vibrio sp. HI00D65]